MTSQKIDDLRRAQAQLQSDAKPPYSGSFVHVKGKC